MTPHLGVEAIKVGLVARKPSYIASPAWEISPEPILRVLEMC